MTRTFRFVSFARWYFGLLAFPALLVAAPPLLHHVHGLAFSPDGGQLLIPSHFGLAVYSNGRWTKAPGPAHDYMGFAATKNYAYSSGHPEPDSGLVNPFGLIRSRDGGKTWEKLGFEGQSDFHVMAASYHRNTVYVYNPGRNAAMETPGIYYTEDDGKK